MCCQSDGSYSLSFARVEWPAPAGQPSAEALQVVLVFTCGTGALGPPAKQGWNASGWIRRRIPLTLAAHSPPLSTLVPEGHVHILKVDCDGCEHGAYPGWAPLLEQGRVLWQHTPGRCVRR